MGAYFANITNLIQNGRSFLLDRLIKLYIVEILILITLSAQEIEVFWGAGALSPNIVFCNIVISKCSLTIFILSAAVTLNSPPWDE